MKRIVICGGHITPAIALVEELQKRYDLNIIFFGRKYATEGSPNLSAEYQLFKDQPHIKFRLITTGRLQRKFTRYTIPSLAKIPIGFIQSFIYLLIDRPQLIVSFGTYLSVPVVFCGWLIGIESVSHEQAAIPGLATRINSLFSKKVFLTWPATRKYISGAKFEVLGNLTRQSIFKKKARDQKIKKFLNSQNTLIFITGGNQGSHFLNNLVFELLPKLKNYHILHQVGLTNFKGDQDWAKSIKLPNYLAVDYLNSDNIGAVFARADLVISRAGANTVWELALLGKVAILIPLPISAGAEQDANAQILKSAGSVIVFKQKELTCDLLSRSIQQIVTNLEKFQQKALIFQKEIPHNALPKFAIYVKQTLDELRG